MQDKSKVKFVSEVSMEDRHLKAKKPFKVLNDEKRRFVRLEISAPISLKAVKDRFGNFFPSDVQQYHYEGNILNASAGGVLVEIEQPISESDIVLMRFSMQGVETLDNVLGVVKRVERSDNLYLAGIEFVSRDYLQDKLSQAEIDLLPDDLRNFEQRVQDVLSKYLYCEKTE